MKMRIPFERLQDLGMEITTEPDHGDVVVSSDNQMLLHRVALALHQQEPSLWYRWIYSYAFWRTLSPAKIA